MRRLRSFLPTEVYFVTIRTVEQRFALSPYASPGAWQRAEAVQLDEEQRQKMTAHGRLCVEETEALTAEIAFAECNEKHPRPEVSKHTFTNSIPNIIGSCLARGVEKFGIHLYGFVWMGNHGHLLMQAPHGNFAEFISYMNGQIAVNVNRFLGRKNQLWARRYAAAQVLDEAAELEMLGYILANPQNAGIANSIEEWPGLSSAVFLFENREQRFLCFDRTSWYENGRPDNIAPFLSTVKLEQKLLPQLAKLGAKKLRRKLRLLIQDKLKPTTTSSAHASSDPSGLAIMDPPQSIQRSLQNRTLIPTDRPAQSKRSSQPLCHTTKPSLDERYREWYKQFRVAYEESARQYKLGHTDVEFPPGSFAPSRYPRARHSNDPDKRAGLHPTRRNLEIADALAAYAT